MAQTSHKFQLPTMSRVTFVSMQIDHGSQFTANRSWQSSKRGPKLNHVKTDEETVIHCEGGIRRTSSVIGIFY